MVILSSAFLTRPKSETEKKWILIPACTSHMWNEKRQFCTFCERKKHIRVGNNEYIQSFEIKTVRVESIVNDVCHNLVLHDVLYAHDIIHILISVPKVPKKSFQVLVDLKDNYRIGKIENVHKHTMEIKMIEFEAYEELYPAMIKVEPREKVNTATGQMKH